MLQISDRKLESFRALNDICKGKSFIHFNLGRNRFFSGDFDSVQFQLSIYQNLGAKAKIPRAKGSGARLPGCENVVSDR